MALALAILSVWMGGSQPPATTADTQLVWTTDDNPLRKGQTSLFNSSQQVLRIVVDPVNQTIEKVIVQALAGVGPDLIDVRDPNQLSAYVKAGIAWDVTDELKTMGIDVESQTWTAMHRLAVFQGRVYGVPTNCAVNAVWVNADLLARSGVALPKTPWTWSQLVDVAQALTIRDKNGKPVRFGFLFDWWNYPHFLACFGAEVFSSDGTECLLDSDEAELALQTMHDLIYKYKVSPSPTEEAGMASAGGWGSGTINLFGAKRGAMALGGRWWLANLRGFQGLQLRVVESPYGTVRRYSVAGRATIVNRNSRRRSQALQFLRFLASADYNALVNHQADGIAAFHNFTTGPSFERDPTYPNEVDNKVWRDTTRYGYNGSTSPFVSGQQANRIMEIQFDLVRIDAKSPRAALRTAARQINRAIQENLRKNGSLRRRWEALTGRRAG